jgi:hypothetical protein
MQKYDNLQFEFINLAQILTKFHSQRTHNELRFISEFIRRNQGLKDLADLEGLDYVKGFMRNVTLEQFKANEIVEYKEAPVDKVYLVLEGKLATIKNDDESDMLA